MISLEVVMTQKYSLFQNTTFISVFKSSIQQAVKPTFSSASTRVKVLIKVVNIQNRNYRSYLKT